MGVYDIDLIMSWTPHEYKLLLKGVEHSAIDEHEKMARSAMWNRYASNAKKVDMKKMFNAEKERKKLEGTFVDEMKEKALKAEKTYKALQGFTPQFQKKGG